MMIIILSVLWGMYHELGPFTYCFTAYESEITKSVFQRRQRGIEERRLVQCHAASQRLGWGFDLFLPDSKDKVLNHY